MVPLVLPPDNNCVIENFCQLELGGQEFRHIKELKKQLSTTIRQVEKITNHPMSFFFFFLIFSAVSISSVFSYFITVRSLSPPSALFHGYFIERRTEGLRVRDLPIAPNGLLPPQRWIKKSFSIESGAKRPHTVGGCTVEQRPALLWPEMRHRIRSHQGRPSE